MYLMKTINKIIDDLTCIFASKRKTGVTTMTVHDICCINRTLRVLFHWQCVLPFGPSRCAHPTPFCSAQQCHVWNPNSASQALAHWCLPDWLWGWKAQHGMEVHKFQENIINIWVYGICVLSNHKSTFSVSMSHSNLATQWEAVGTLRDKARKLELAPSL